MAGKKVALCYVPEDGQLAHAIPGIKAALDAWEVAWLDLSVLAPAQEQQAQQVIDRCEVFLRLCTPAIARSPEAVKATNHFRNRLERDRGLLLVNLVMTPGYEHDARDGDRLHIDTAGKDRKLWLEELAVSLGVATITQRISRRALVGMSAAIGAAVFAGGAATDLFIQKQRASVAPVPVSRSSGQPRWSAQLGTPSNDLLDVPILSVDGSTVYALIQGKLTAFDGVRGASRHVPLDFPVEDFQTMAVDAGGFASPTLTKSLTVSGGVAFIRGAFQSSGAVNASDLTAARVDTGQAMWRLALEEYRQPVVVDNTVVFFAFTSDAQGAIGTSGPTGMSRANGVSTLRAQRVSDGRLLWSHPVAQTYEMDPRGVQWSKLVVQSNRVYAASADHRLYAFNAHTGAQLWSYQTGGAVSTPAATEQTVFVGSEDYFIYALDATTGAVRWRYLTAGGISAAPLVNGSVVYVASEDGHVYALDAVTGALYWRVYAGLNEAQDPAHTSYVSPTIYRNILVATWGASLFAYDLRSGTPSWHFAAAQTPPPYMSVQPLTTNGLFVFGAPDKLVYGLNP